MNIVSFLPAIGTGIATVLAAIAAVNIVSWRVVVDTNKVHIVQSGKKTISYGVGETAGNVYYRVPSWIPGLGVTTSVLPVNAFQMPLLGYNAYDKDRVPFDLDITAFFRIQDTNLAASRIATFDELKSQLTSVVQGAVRKILASYDIHQIMTDRSTFGEQFTKEVADGVKELGVIPTKSLELMDIRDSKESHVIGSIMKVKTSQIEADSRIAVAKNEQIAKEAEIASVQLVETRNQEALQKIGERRADQERLVGIAKQKSEQDVQAEMALTTAKQMEVLSVQTQRKAEIDQRAAVVTAEQVRQTTILEAEGQKQRVILAADAALEKATRDAKATTLQGEAQATAQKLAALAPIEAQIVLAKEIGENDGYQTYLVKLETIKAGQVVGVAQAEALKVADIKVIANTGDVSSGISGLSDLFTSKGGTGLGGFLEGLANTEQGAKLLNAVATKKDKP